MTDRIRTLTVLLDDDTRVDDAEAIISALKMTRGVADVWYDDSSIILPKDHLARRMLGRGMGDFLFEISEALVKGQRFRVEIEK